MRTILHIDFNSYFATVEQQANPRLRGKPVGVTGGDRIKRTVLGAASIEAKKYGVKTGMLEWAAKKLCPQIILVKGDSDKYLEVTKRFINILEGYSPNLEVFSIDEVFMEMPNPVILSTAKNLSRMQVSNTFAALSAGELRDPSLTVQDDNIIPVVKIAQEIKSRIRAEIGEWMSCSIGISYNKLMAKLASSLQKPDGLIVIPDQESAIKVLDQIELDEICGIGRRIKKRLFNMGITNFANLRKASQENLAASFKSYGLILWKMSRGLDDTPITPFFEKEEVKSIGHRHTIDHDTNDPVEIKQILLKLTELIARKLRAKKLVGRTVSCWYRQAFNPVNSWGSNVFNPGGWIGSNPRFQGDGMQTTIPYTNDGLEIFKTAWKIFNQMWPGERIRMIGTSISNLKPLNPQNLTLLPEISRQEKITEVLDKINDKFGEFTLQRGILLGSQRISRKPNPYLADRRFKI